MKTFVHNKSLPILRKKIKIKPKELQNEIKHKSFELRPHVNLLFYLQYPFCHDTK